MTRTINPDNYAQLLAKYQPKVIELLATQLYFDNLC